MARFSIQHNRKGTIVQIESAAVLLPLVETTLKLCDNVRVRTGVVAADNRAAGSHGIGDDLAGGHRAHVPRANRLEPMPSCSGVLRNCREGQPSWTAYGWRAY